MPSNKGNTLVDLDFSDDDEDESMLQSSLNGQRAEEPAAQPPIIETAVNNAKQEEEEELIFSSDSESDSEHLPPQQQQQQQQQIIPIADEPTPMDTDTCETSPIPSPKSKSHRHSSSSSEDRDNSNNSPLSSEEYISSPRSSTAGGGGSKRLTREELDKRDQRDRDRRKEKERMDLLDHRHSTIDGSRSIRRENDSGRNSVRGGGGGGEKSNGSASGSVRRENRDRERSRDRGRERDRDRGDRSGRDPRDVRDDRNERPKGDDRKRKRDDVDDKKRKEDDGGRSRSKSRDRGNSKRDEAKYVSPDRKPRIRSRDRRDDKERDRSRSKSRDRRNDRSRDWSLSRSRSKSKDRNSDRRKRDTKRNRSRSRDRSPDKRRDDEKKDAKRKGGKKDEEDSKRSSSARDDRVNHLNTRKGNESPVVLPPPSSSSTSAKNIRTESQQHGTPPTPIIAKKVSLSEYNSKKDLLSVPHQHQRPKPIMPAVVNTAAAVAPPPTMSGETSKLNWRSLVAIHKHKGDEINQRSKDPAGVPVTEQESHLLMLHYCASVFYSLLETGKDDAQISSTHTLNTSLLQFVLKRLSRSKMSSIYALMLRLETVLLSRFARKKSHDTAKRAKALSAFIAEQGKQDPFATKFEVEFANTNFPLLKETLQLSVDVDQAVRKAELNWTTAEKLCPSYHDAFPSAGSFQITAYCEYKDFAEYGISCLRDYADKNGCAEFLSV
ncbi:hypothetical protein BDR26DRAFT_874122 [Obelidium mucronatum]|nr:hypothetical protein BDR26DRAFT_874122 [Obelidium mucronatum]